jgi:aryl-alcohol dehydrogenase-like predicted oxidoreductase
MIPAWVRRWRDRAIVGARRPDHIDGWIAAAELQLDDADLTEIATAISRSGAGTGPSRPSLRTERTSQAPSSAPDT